MLASAGMRQAYRTPCLIPGNYFPGSCVTAPSFLGSAWKSLRHRYALTLPGIRLPYGTPDN